VRTCGLRLSLRNRRLVLQQASASASTRTFGGSAQDILPQISAHVGWGAAASRGTTAAARNPAAPHSGKGHLPRWRWAHRCRWSCPGDLRRTLPARARRLPSGSWAGSLAWPRRSGSQAPGPRAMVAVCSTSARIAATSGRSPDVPNRGAMPTPRRV
jgi:hypothetical protein